MVLIITEVTFRYVNYNMHRALKTRINKRTFEVINDRQVIFNLSLLEDRDLAKGGGIYSLGFVQYCC